MMHEALEQRRGVSSPVIYLVDDDAEFRDEILLGLSNVGLKAEGFPDALSLYRAFAVTPADVVLIDIMLEGEDGLSIARHLRNLRSVGIIMVTARGSLADRVSGLETGADAYLVKPIEVRELAATITSVSERLAWRATQSSGRPQWALVEGHRLRLTASERGFLQCLLSHQGNTVERDSIVEALGGDFITPGHLNTIVSRLRKRASKSGMALPLHAVRGKGFSFAG
jgi:two-component system response regulator PhoP